MSPTKFSVEYQDITKRQYRLALSVLFLSGILHVASPLLPHLATIVKYACTGQTDKITKVILVDINRAISSPKHVFPELTPTPLSEEETREILLGEYENFRKDHNVPSFGALDPKRQGKLDPNATWKTLFLRVYGIDTCMAKYFPKSLKAIDESGLGAVTIMFSRMAPGAELPRHVGPSKVVLRHLLALKVPKARGANLQVWPCPECEPTRQDWLKAGDELIFDDTFLHYAANPTREERVALFMDLKRPDTKGWREHLINDFILWLIRVVPFPQKVATIESTNSVCRNMA